MGAPCLCCRVAVALLRKRSGLYTTHQSKGGHKRRPASCSTSQSISTTLTANPRPPTSRAVRLIIPSDPSHETPPVPARSPSRYPCTTQDAVRSGQPAPSDRNVETAPTSWAHVTGSLAASKIIPHFFIRDYPQQTCTVSIADRTLSTRVPGAHREDRWSALAAKSDSSTAARRSCRTKSSARRHLHKKTFRGSCLTAVRAGAQLDHPAARTCSWTTDEPLWG